MFPIESLTGAPVPNAATGALLAVTLGLAQAGAWAAEPIAIKNDLAACVVVKAGPPSSQDNAVLANVRFDLRKSIGECGCLSALATYTSSVNRDGAPQFLQEGLIGLKGSADKTLVLATEPALIGKLPIQVRLACAGPR